MVVLHLRALDSSFTASCGESRHFLILGSSILDITSYGSSIAVISALSGAAVYSASNHGTDVRLMKNKNWMNFTLMNKTTIRLEGGGEKLSG